MTAIQAAVIDHADEIGIALLTRHRTAEVLAKSGDAEKS